VYVIIQYTGLISSEKAHQVKILVDYASSMAKQSKRMDIFLQGLILRGNPLNYTPASSCGTSSSLTKEMTGIFQSFWAAGLNYFLPQNVLEDCKIHFLILQYLLTFLSCA